MRASCAALASGQLSVQLALRIRDEVILETLLVFPILQWGWVVVRKAIDFVACIDVLLVCVAVALALGRAAWRVGLREQRVSG